MLSITMTRRIEWGDCDPAGIVYNPNFFSYFDNCTALLYEAGGWPKDVMLKRFGVSGCPVVDTRARFLLPSTYGDVVTIESTVTHVGTSSFRVQHQLAKDGTLRVEGNEVRVWAVQDDQTGRLRSAPLPAELAAALRGDA